MSLRQSLFLESKVSSEIEAYLLGFIYADGCVTGKTNNKYYLLSFSLSEKDKEFLLMLSSLFGNYEIKRYVSKVKDKIFYTATLNIGDVNLVSRLIGLGIVPNKTYQNDSFVFDNVPNDLKSHFIRGYFDGDGTAAIYSNKPRVGFVSKNESLLNSILHFLSVKGLVTKTKVRLDKASKCYRLILNGVNGVIWFRDFVYSDAGNVYLPRKYEKLKAVKNVLNADGGSKLTKEQAKAIYESDDSYANIAKDFGISKSCITNIKKGKLWKTCHLSVNG